MVPVVLAWDGWPPEHVRGGAVAVGNFDGVHRGHAALLALTRQAATAHSAPVVAVTFDPPPLALLAPERLPPPLTTLDQRIALMAAIGVDAVVVLRTGPELLALTAESFFEEVLQRRLRTCALIEGFNFQFGRGRVGTNALLAKLCHAAGIPFAEAPPLLEGVTPISSSRIRAALMAGEVATARTLLGRHYEIAGTVESGAQRGRTIGFPTANLGGVPTLVPAEGVYAVRAWIDGRSWAAAANVGPNPTFGELSRKVEVHLLDFAGDLYGQSMRVEFVARLRETRRFANVDELVAQMRHDIGQARTILEATT